VPTAAYAAATCTSFLEELGARSDLFFTDNVDKTLDALAQHLERHFAIDQLLGLAELVKVDA
jgi:adenosylcobyric acid synthase